MSTIAKKCPSLTIDQFKRLSSRTKLSGSCRIWCGSKSNTGYGQIGIHGRVYLVHRVFWSQLVGQPRRDRVIDHKCKNKLCVNVAHLRLVTQRENVLCGDGPTSKNSKKTHCKNGHKFTTNNTYVRPKYPNYRKCIICSKMYWNKYRISKRKDIKIKQHQYRLKNRDKLINYHHTRRVKIKHGSWIFKKEKI